MCLILVKYLLLRCNFIKYESCTPPKEGYRARPAARDRVHITGCACALR